MRFTVLRAAAVHVLTASAAALALLALLAASHEAWHAMFFWLGIALLVDGIDGPLARRFKVAEILPRWSGERLDWIVDYLTYVAVPAFAVCKADLLPASWRLVAAIAILLSSLFHFVDRDSKTAEGYFVGFPAEWNVVCFLLFVFGLPQTAALALIALLVGLTFVPLLYVHPVRSKDRRLLNGAALAVWTIFAALALLHPFPSPLTVRLGIGLSSAYLVASGLIASWQASRRGSSQASQ